MRHPTAPPNHSRLYWTVVAVFVCFAAMIAWESDKANDQAIRIELMAHIGG